MKKFDFFRGSRARNEATEDSDRNYPLVQNKHYVHDSYRDGYAVAPRSFIPIRVRNSSETLRQFQRERDEVFHSEPFRTELEYRV